MNRFLPGMSGKLIHLLEPDLISVVYPVLGTEPAHDFHHVEGIADRALAVQGLRLGIGTNVQYFKVLINEDDIQGDVRIAHPKRLWFRPVHNEEHALGVFHRPAPHHAGIPFLRVLFDLYIDRFDQAATILIEELQFTLLGKLGPLRCFGGFGATNGFEFSNVYYP